MPHYVFTYMVDGSCKMYAESTPAEEWLDIDEDGNRHVDMTGNGYLAFWERCKGMVRDYERIARAYENNQLVSDGDRDEFYLGEDVRGIIADLDSGMEKVIA